jgi:arsenate reductase (thioredoxin)
MSAAAPQTKLHVLFLCTGNSCRSQLAEALTNTLLGERWQASSAGTQPSGYVHPLAIRSLKEIGITHQGYSKSVDQFRETPFDLVITLCDDADQNCPVWLGKGKRLHIGFPDPAEVQGSEEQKMAAFRQVREDIKARVLPVLMAYHPAVAGQAKESHETPIQKGQK